MGAEKDLTVSIIVPTYNRERTLLRAIHSALPQMRDGDELIVIDDGSTDGTASLVAGLDDRVRLIKQDNAGAGAARNAGIAASTGDLVAFLDSDDEWMPGKLEAQRRFIQSRQDVLFCCSNFATTDSEGVEYRWQLRTWSRDERPWQDIIGAEDAFSKSAVPTEEYGDFSVYIGNLAPAQCEEGYVLTSSMVVRRELAGDALYFAEDVATLEDLECFGRLALKGPVAYFDIEMLWQHGQESERLSLVLGIARDESMLTVLQRVWGEDHQFQREYKHVYLRAISHWRRQLVMDLLRSGQASKARAVMRKVGGIAFKFRLAAMMPDWLLAKLAGR